jgi:protein involved in polysaccharide export with SLBB domain
MRYFYYFLFGLFSGVLIWIHPLYAQEFQAIPIQTPPKTQAPAVLPQQQGLQGQPQQGPVQPQTQPQVQPQAQPQVQPQTQPQAQPQTQPQIQTQPLIQQGIPEKVEVEEVSEFENFLMGRLPYEVSLKLSQFGYDLFKRPPTTFAPVDKVPVGPDYVIGPGDEIRINVWGRIEGSYSVVVDRDGNIAIPKIGVIGVTGLTFKELKEVLQREFSKYYTGFEMNVSMGQLRTIRVYVVGHAERPGAYTVSSLSTLVNALFEAGGPSKTGSMRNIEVKRNGKTIVHFDMYDLLLRGDKTKDIRLMPEDVIYIPPVGPLVAIAGSVKRPAIYELKDETRLTGLISMAGGLSATAYLQRIQVERIYQNEVKIILDTDLKDITDAKDIILHDRDIVKIFPIINVVINAVNLKGNVTKPGQYQWFEGMRVSDIIKNPEKDLLPDTYYEHALIERFIPPDFHREVIHINLGKAIFEKDEKENKLLQPYDTLTIYSKWEFIERPMVRIAGAVNKPGTYEFKENMRALDLINMAGGFKYFAYTKSAELTRVTPTQEGPKTEKIIFSPEKALEGDPEHNIKLQQDDYIFIRTVPEWDLYKTVQITGEVKFPGTYTIKKGEKLSDLLKRAGGFTDKAYLRGAVFTRPSVKELQQKQIDELIDRLERELLSVSSATVATAMTPEEAKIFQTETEQKRQFLNRLRQVKALGRIVVRLDEPERLVNTPYDIELEEGDSIYIPSKSSTIQVIGSVYNQTAFIYSPEKDLSDYIDLAGGYTENADKGNVFILKVDGSAVKPGKGFFGIRWNKESKRWELGGSQLEPGDTIVVPEKLTRIAWMREIKDITQILYQIAVTAGVLIVAF